MRVYLYVAVVTAAALLLLPLSTRVHGVLTGRAAALSAVGLAVLIAGAHRQPVVVGPRRRANVATAPELAAILLLPGPVSVLTLAAGVLAGEARLSARPIQRLFNVAVAAWRAIAGGVTYTAVVALASGPVIEPLAALGAAVAVYATGTLLVIGVVSVQLHENPMRRARVPQRALLLSEAALSLIGIMAALAIREQAWALVLLIAPAAIARRSLRDVEARYRGIFEHAAEGIFQTGFDGRFQAVNPTAARMLGYTSPEQLMSEVADLRQLYVEPHREQEYARLMETEGEVTSFEFQARRRDGDIRWLSLNARAVGGADGRFRSVEGLLADISGRKTAEAEREQLLQREREARAAAEAANRAKDEFLSLLSHELRTPLTPILGFAELLRRRKPDEATLVRALDMIERNAKVQARLVSDLLDVSRIVTGKLQLQLQPSDPRSIINLAIDTVRTAADAKAISLIGDLQPDVDPVMGDPDRLQQVVWNLLVNAVKFTPEGGRVDISLEQAGSDACIAVKDTGQGIEAAFLPYVFERFRQADASNTRISGGLGLGLAIVRHLVEMHGGSVSAASDGPGQGATFTVRLPCIPAAHRIDGTGSEPVADDRLMEPARLTRLHILVAEDDPDTRGFLVAALEAAGATVTAVASAADAEMALDEGCPSLLLTDIAMPGEDGYSLIARVRARPAHAGGRIPAAAITAYASSDDRRRVLAAGFQEHLPKPIDAHTLVSAAARLACPRTVDGDAMTAVEPVHLG
jgi:PAS domain S-box-containing protein